MLVVRGRDVLKKAISIAGPLELLSPLLGPGAILLGGGSPLGRGGKPCRRPP